MLFFNKQTNQLEMDPFKRNPSGAFTGGRSAWDEFESLLCGKILLWQDGWSLPPCTWASGAWPVHLLGLSVIPCRWGWGVEWWSSLRGGCECQSQNFRGPLSRLTPCSQCSEGNQEAVLEQSTVAGEDPDRCGVHRWWQRVLICGNEHGVLEDSNSNGATLL